MSPFIAITTFCLLGMTASAMETVQPSWFQQLVQHSGAEVSSQSHPGAVELPRNALIRFGRSHSATGELPRNALVRFGRSAGATATPPSITSHGRATHDDIAGMEKEDESPQPYFRKSGIQY